MLKIIGAGFGRTGTHSLGQALEILGFGPCYNVLALSKHPHHLTLWKQALEHKKFAWGEIFKEYKSSVEWPGVSFLPALLQQYPHAKIILTLRNPEAWYESAAKTIFAGLEISAHHPDPEKRKSSAFLRNLILTHTFDNAYWQKEQTLGVYEQHVQRVREMVPQQQLLQYHIQEGWEPLCAFLEKPRPQEPFPKLNVRAEFLASAPTWVKKINRNLRGNNQIED